jgi:hypothetical protein
MSNLDAGVLYDEIESLLVGAPELSELKTENGTVWLGRVSSAIKLWDVTETIVLRMAIDNIFRNHAIDYKRQYDIIIHILRTAKNDIRLKSIGPSTTLIPKGETYTYFEEIRKIIKESSKEMFFIDAYIDADFVKNYFPHIKDGIIIKILTSTKGKLNALKSATDMYSQQHGSKVEIRTNDDIHDRWMIIDQSECYQSGASIKDGGKNAATTITQVVDIASVTIGHYNAVWPLSSLV